MDPEKLARENEALNEQIKLLVKTERRLYGAQRVIETQLRRFQALCRLALQTGRAGTPERILALTLKALLEAFDVDQGVAFLVGDRGELDVAAARTRDGCHPRLDGAGAPRAWPAPSLHAPLLLDDRRPMPALDPAVTALLERLGRSLACDMEGPEPARARAPIEVLLPLVRKDKRLLGLVVLRKLSRAASYHETLIEEGDLPFMALVGTHVETALENVILYRQVRSFAAHLEDKIAARTADLARANRELARGMRRLQETQHKLIQAGKTAAVLTLVAGLSHELNNPIGVIIGYAQLLLSQVPADSPWRVPLEAVDRQARRCRRLVVALLEFARDGPVAREPTSAAALVRGAVARVESRAAERGVALQVDTDDEHAPMLRVGIAEVEAALFAVLANAIDASAPGAAVVVQARRQPRGRCDGVEICVRDEGSGIPEHVLPRIFDPFFTTKQVGHGIGIGLPVAQQTIESHGGRIDVRSAPSQGTTVLVWLPAAAGDARHADRSAGDAR